MKKEEKLEMIPKISYPYKVIHSFFINFYDVNEYNLIKNAVLGINDFNNKYINYYRLYLIFSSLGDYHNYKEVIPFFNTIFQGIFDNLSVTNIIDNSFKEENILYGITSLLYEIPNFCQEEAFFIYLVMQLMINDYYKSLIVLPHDINKNKSFTTSKTTFAYYLNGVLIKKVQKKSRTLLIDIINLYQENITQIKMIGVENIYLFGSIKDNDYHRESDIDLVISIKDFTYKKMVDCFDYLKKFNLTHFGRESDIHEYNDFIEFNPNINLLKIF